MKCPFQDIRQILCIQTNSMKTNNVRPVRIRPQIRSEKSASVFLPGISPVILHHTIY